MTRKNRTSKAQSPARRRDMLLLLPMPRTEVDELVLMYRAALEAAKLGYNDAPLTRRLYTAVLLTRFLTDAGHGLLEQQVLDDAEKQLTAVYDQGNATGTWHYPKETITLLTAVLNEHDRQLRDTPLQVLLDASARLDRIIEKSGESALVVVH
ncbi:hypothetical protein [Paraburkholderia phenoliruptrix]|uniref:hypothetical protein n=1 Tax=Paraburkholderia phenoliruptrix TaxID=252970 RepID=UPI002869C474|nr:hypothetical protein [Paraburkholderia phenoliruptrix]WMY10959.1 hypothetical protein P3F88_30230 [Paraburkholderia phenoliruptrix]